MSSMVNAIPTSCFPIGKLIFLNPFLANLVYRFCKFKSFQKFFQIERHTFDDSLEWRPQRKSNGFLSLKDRVYLRKPISVIASEREKWSFEALLATFELFANHSLV